MIQLTLSRRNLETLLNKLDRARDTPDNPSVCTLIVSTEPLHGSMQAYLEIMVTAVEDAVKYANRTPGYSLDTQSRDHKNGCNKRVAHSTM